MLKSPFSKTSPRIALLLWSAFAGVAHADFLVVLDPGHGGNDHGTLHESGGRRLAEKDVTLALAQEAALQLRVMGFKVQLTRKDDSNLALPDRTALANRLKADIFVSIHMNGAPGKHVTQAHGVETYILNNTSDESSKRIARLENSILGGSQTAGVEGNRGESLDVALILKDLTLDANLSESKRLACNVQTELSKTTAQALAALGGKTLAATSYQIQSRGVKQALFHVLLGADMPGILIEAGFLDHPRDREFVLAPAGRIALGRAIARAVDRFRRAKGSPQAQRDITECRVR